MTPDSNSLFPKDRLMAHLGVKYNDAEYTRLQAPWSEEEWKEKTGGRWKEHFDQLDRVTKKLYDPLADLVEEYFETNYSMLLGSKNYDVVFGIPKSSANAFVAEAEKRFPTYSFMLTIDPADNRGNFIIIDKKK